MGLEKVEDEWEAALTNTGIKYKQRVDSVLRSFGFSRDVANVVIEYASENESKKNTM